MYNMVGIGDYQGVPGFQGFGLSSEGEMDNLNKALQAGYTTDPLQFQGGSVFRVESLENSLKVVTYTDQHIKFWKKIPKMPAYNTVEQYAQLQEYGSVGAGAFVGEGALPNTQDSTYARKAAFVKFLGTTREVTHPMTLVNSAFGNVITRQNQDGILWLLKQLELGLFWGDSKLAPGGNEGVEFDGINKLIDSANTIDLKGSYMEEKHINWGAQIILQNYGTPTDIFVPFEVMAEFSEQFFPKERVIVPTQTGGYQAGVVVNKFMTHGGEVEFNPDIFLSKTRPMGSNASSPQAPAVGTLAAGALAGTDGDFAKSAPTGGVFKYAVTFCNKYGESVPSAAATVTFASADVKKHVPLTITNPASSAFPVEFVRVYRTEAGGSKYYEIAKFAVTSSNASADTTWNDVNTTMPNSYTAFMGEMSPEVISFKQLAPMMKMDLATLGPVIRWMILLYGVPVIYAPRKWVRFTNIQATIPGFLPAI